EDDEAEPYLLLTITDAEGKVVDRIKQPAKKGMHRVTWNLRYPPTSPVQLPRSEPELPWELEDEGPLVLPGTYYVSLGSVVDGEYNDLVSKVPFVVRTLDNTTLPAEDREALVSFLNDVEELGRSVYGAARVQRELLNHIEYIEAAILETSEAPAGMMQQVREAEKKLLKIGLELNGDQSLARRQFETMPSIADRVGSITYGMWYSTSEPTQTARQNYAIAAETFTPVYAELKSVYNEIGEMEKTLESYGAPYTPGRMPLWE
ncbi:MAG: glycosyl hydrolase, partial [Cyclobacteriaceae bacterium]